MEYKVLSPELDSSVELVTDPSAKGHGNHFRLNCSISSIIFFSYSLIDNMAFFPHKFI